MVFKLQRGEGMGGGNGSAIVTVKYGHGTKFGPSSACRAHGGGRWFVAPHNEASLECHWHVSGGVSFWLKGLLMIDQLPMSACAGGFSGARKYFFCATANYLDFLPPRLYIDTVSQA